MPLKDHTLLEICPVCQSTEHDLWQRKNGYDVVKCRKCSFIFTRDFPSVEYLARRYGKSYSKDKVFKPKGGLGRDLKYKAFKTWIKRYFPKNKTIRLLEVGCGQGDLLKAVQNDPRYEATGLDFSEARTGYARSVGLDARVGDIQSQNFEDESFDLVVALHVIEHVHDLHSTISEINKVLKPGGHFFAACPCVSHYKAKLAGNDWKYLGPPGHLWYFSPKTFSRLFDNEGFDVLHASCLYHRAHVRILGRKQAS
ncbi:MAG: class I SAM-dependent methyltransferase [Verrucomicrobiota bacterium]